MVGSPPKPVGRDEALADGGRGGMPVDGGRGGMSAVGGRGRDVSGPRAQRGIGHRRTRGEPAGRRLHEAGIRFGAPEFGSRGSCLRRQDLLGPAAPRAEKLVISPRRTRPGAMRRLRRDGEGVRGSRRLGRRSVVAPAVGDDGRARGSGREADRRGPGGATEDRRTGGRSRESDGRAPAAVASAAVVTRVARGPGPRSLIHRLWTSGARRDRPLRSSRPTRSRLPTSRPASGTGRDGSRALLARRVAPRWEALRSEAAGASAQGHEIDARVGRRVEIGELAQQDVAQRAGSGDEGQYGRRRRRADDGVQVVLAARAAVHVLGQRRTQRGVELAAPAERELGELRAVLPPRRGDGRRGERPFELAPRVGQQPEPVRRRETGRAVPQPEDEREAAAVQAVPDGQLEHLAMRGTEPLGLGPRERLELGAAQVALELDEGHRDARLVERVRLGPQPPRGGSRRVRLGGPQPTFVAEHRVEPGLDLLRLLKVGVVAVRGDEGAVHGVGRGVVVAQVPECVGVQSVGVGVVGGSPPPAVARGTSEHGCGDGVPPARSVSVHPNDARRANRHTSPYLCLITQTGEDGAVRTSLVRVKA
jgi:hypothetical protein